MNIRMPQIVKEQVEQVLREILYEEKTLELMDSTVRRIKALVGDGYFVGYVPSDLHGEVKFVLGTKLSPDAEYTVWMVSLAPAKWEPSEPPIDKPEEDEPEEGENVDGDEPPVPEAEEQG